ncbi:MAG: succinate--CoA ligase subunit alpha [Anaerolineae bacterium]|nr:succinate--CoA ligase subunit alpha [Anaerolineae bacterium]
MSILLDAETRVLVQGITGREGRFHTQRMLDYGTKVVAGVVPGRGGEWVHGVPVFDSVREAMVATEAEASVTFVPARFATDAIYEAAFSGIKLIVSVTEGIPVHDVVRLRRFLAERNARLIGPNSPGIVVPGAAKLGIMPGSIHTPGPVGVLSRSSTLTYEIVAALSRFRLGQSTVVGIGGDYVVGTGFVELLELLNDDPDTEEVVLIGEIGGMEEQLAAEYIGSHMSKPVVAYIAGLTAPPRKRIGHPGAIVDRSDSSAQEKIEALRAAGVQVAEHPAQVAELLQAGTREGA